MNFLFKYIDIDKLDIFLPFRNQVDILFTLIFLQRKFHHIIDTQEETCTFFWEKIKFIFHSGEAPFEK